jgi:hypothetical protein
MMDTPRRRWGTIGPFAEIGLTNTGTLSLDGCEINILTGLPIKVSFVCLF